MRVTDERVMAPGCVSRSYRAAARHPVVRPAASRTHHARARRHSARFPAARRARVCKYRSASSRRSKLTTRSFEAEIQMLQDNQ